MPEGVLDLKLFRRGKVRDVYDLGDKLLLVASDRISAFDHILPTPIPDKGKLLTAISAHWFRRQIIPSHFLSDGFEEISSALPPHARVERGGYFDGRVTLARKARRIDAECVVRGYLAGSGWKEYLQTGSVCGHRLPSGLSQGGELPSPIFTPASKSEHGHDENISREELAKLCGTETARELERLSLNLYRTAAAELKPKGLILADTKFEFGFSDDSLIVIDEMLTPDSSRLWDASRYRPGGSPESFDKQFVRDYLEKIRWDKNPPVPVLPPDVVSGTAARYRDALRIITS